MSAWPHFDRWFEEQRELVRQAGLKYPALPAVENQINPITLQEAKPMLEADAVESVEAPVVRCEYCHEVLKSDKRQARAVHLRYCEAYKAVSDKPKKNGAAAHTPPTPVLDENGQAVALTPERVSKLWQAVTGGTLAMTIEDGQIVCRVSKSSFDRALPVLLDLL